MENSFVPTFTLRIINDKANRAKKGQVIESERVNEKGVRRKDADGGKGRRKRSPDVESCRSLLQLAC